MAKKKTTKQNQLLSPEKYIRIKSRNLPIYKCWINDEWRKTKIAEVVIARQHANGNITVCIYLADLACLGIKDTQYLFNVKIEDFYNSISKIPAHFIDIPYKLAHNVILAAIRYAAKYGFPPYIGYTQTTSFFLEGEDKKIPRMSIPCGGKNGKPMYVNTGHESPAQEKEILKHLDQIVGKGNYNYLLRADMKDEFDEDEFEDDDELFANVEKEYLRDEKEIRDMAKGKRYKLFMKLFTNQVERKGKQNDEDRLSLLSDIIAEEIMDKEEVAKELEIMKEHLTHTVVGLGDLPNSMLAGIPDDPTIIDDYTNLFDIIVGKTETEDKIAEALDRFQEKAGEAPIACYTRLLHLEKTDFKKSEKALKEYCNKYPDYFLFTVKRYFNKMRNGSLTIDEVEEGYTLLLAVKEPVTDYEFEIFFSFYTAISLGYHLETEKGFSRAIAFERLVFEQDWDLIKHNRFQLLVSIMPMKTLYIARYLMTNKLI
ncbi:MAG: hypothetical protein LBQ73_03325 [Tannerellaceae bacterium]|jgi:hypothetical protein|nr:hypothetical protein [Tannerellaceae bacterium]